MVAKPKPFYIGLMSGTSLDGVDGVVTNFGEASYAAYLPFPSALKTRCWRCSRRAAMRFIARHWPRTN